MISVGSNLLYEEPDPEEEEEEDEEGRKMAKEQLSALFRTTLANLRMYFYSY